MSFLKQKCKLDEPANLSSHDALIGRLKMVIDDSVNVEINYSKTYEDFKPKKIIWQDIKNININVI